MAGGSERLAWLDHARAAGIVLVVFGHAVRSIDRSGLEAPPVLELVDDAIYSFHMPLFFLLAGMTQTIAGRKPTGAALAAAGWGILLPYALWSTVWFALKEAFSGAANRGLADSYVSILWHPEDHFWFLYVLLLLRLAWIAVDATDSTVLRRAAVLVPLVVAFVGAGPADGTFNAFLFFWAAFYGVGLVVGGSVGAVPWPRLAVGGAVALGLWAAIVTSIPDLLSTGFGAARTLAGLAGSAALVAAAVLAGRRGRIGRFVAFVGEASLTIFLTHTLFGAASRIVLDALGLLSPMTLLTAAVTTGILGPLVFHVAVMRVGMATGKPIGRWLGLGAQRRSQWIDLAPRRPAAVRLGDPAS